MILALRKFRKGSIFEDLPKLDRFPLSLSHVFLLLIQKELMNNPAPMESL
jgi:hypothetical protein